MVSSRPDRDSEDWIDRVGKDEPGLCKRSASVRHVHKTSMHVLPFCRLDVKHIATTAQVQLVKMQRVMKHGKYVAISSVDTGKCMDLSLFKTPRKAET